jgi:hypothetical protein
MCNAEVGNLGDAGYFWLRAEVLKINGTVNDEVVCHAMINKDRRSEHGI